MRNDPERSHIPESFFEHRQLFPEPWFDLWIHPNPFFAALLHPLRASGVELADFSNPNETANLADRFLNVSIRRLNAAVRIGLDTVTFTAASPDWENASQLLDVFDRVSSEVQRVIGFAPASQITTLAFHVTPGSSDFGQATAAFVNRAVLGDCQFYGISLHRKDSVLIIDKSLRYRNAAFVRLQRTFDGGTMLSEVAARLFEDQVKALGLLGVQEVP